jgi:hypothetical protein
VEVSSGGIAAIVVILHSLISMIVIPTEGFSPSGGTMPFYNQ